jgi:tRNA-Thr(GGU) m(6)t(6)A37 methyltransferase TsaA
MREAAESEVSVSMDMSLTPIGVVHTTATDDEIRAEEHEIEGELEIFDQFTPALEGIDGYSHLFLICYFHRLRPGQVGPLQVRPRRLAKRGFSPADLPLLGVLALDSPTRPNPIALTLVRLVGRDGNRLRVEGLDCFDGTPILDIKAYQPDYRAAEFSLPAWYRRLMDETGHI